MGQSNFKIGDLVISVAAECDNNTCTMHPCAPTREFVCNLSANILDMTVPQLKQMKRDLKATLKAIEGQENRKKAQKDAKNPQQNGPLAAAGDTIFVAFTVKNPATGSPT
jgi:hypothetical protein